MLGERGHVRAEAAEQEAAIFLEGGEPGEIVTLALERLGIAAGLVQLDPLVAAGAVIGPAVIGADMQAGIAGLGLGEPRALVHAAVDEGAERCRSRRG